jgi:hypothetical protein
MKVLYVTTARTIWLFDFTAINPTGLSLRGVIASIAERYQFAKAPKNELDIDDNRLSFRSGAFSGKRGVPILVQLSIYNDGFVADCMSSTDESAEFLIDLATWLKNNHGLTVPQPPSEVNHLSQIDFESDMSLAAVNPSFPRFAKTFDGFDKRRKYEVGSIQFWTEEFGKAGTVAAVRIERKIGAPFSSNHYFSQAPFPTAVHLELIGEFENGLKKG